MAVTQTTTDEIEIIDEVAARALTEPMTVMSSVGIVRGTKGMYEVTSESEYIVDLEAPSGARCLCPDHKYRGRECKHIKRAKFETGREPIPAWVDPDDVDDVLGMWVEGEPRWSR
ncbi:hypothetical protein [Natronococcus jeotgali]|uniref:SWIM-type domain-containing protein n=1 Tax=Natronococcus jeotgali DSM 18795 TaxID=1227498 RepID=L9WXL1_9EURY|nr:hypothetical protein [Natronococcus jeotgali]ELY54210.1 hypothetical protein C492_16573 [Natronococcus jeotgali DSM 18795]